uniref:Uncharacterized protein n=1 Tax=Oryza barthii TaxID=65489 RepID=A0A0D3HRS2_9ORYZ
MSPLSQFRSEQHKRKFSEKGGATQEKTVHGWENTGEHQRLDGVVTVADQRGELGSRSMSIGRLDGVEMLADQQSVLGSGSSGRADHLKDEHLYAFKRKKNL